MKGSTNIVQLPCLFMLIVHVDLKYTAIGLRSNFKVKSSVKKLSEPRNNSLKKQGRLEMSFH